MLALADKLNVVVSPNKEKVEEIFKVDRFLAGVKFEGCKVRAVELVGGVVGEIDQASTKELTAHSQYYFSLLQSPLNLPTSALPYFIKRNKPLHNKILLLLSHIISPTTLNIAHLAIY